MALKSVVEDSFFQSVIVALSAYQRLRGRLSFAMLSSSRIARSQWDLTIASDWMDTLSPLKVGMELSEFLDLELADQRGKLGLVKIRSTSDLLVRSLTSELDIPQLGTAYQISGLDLDLFSIDEAVCLLSRPAMRESMPEKVPA